MDEQDFRERARRDGFAEPTPVNWAAGRFNDTHAHPFACAIYVLSGEITVACDGERHTYGPGDVGRMARDRPHTERVGPDGVKLLVARK